MKTVLTLISLLLLQLTSAQKTFDMTNSGLDPIAAAAATSIVSEINCKLRYDQIDTQNWSDMGRGVGLGLFFNYTSNDTYGCAECNDLGTRVANVN